MKYLTGSAKGDVILFLVVVTLGLGLSVLIPMTEKWADRTAYLVAGVSLLTGLWLMPRRPRRLLLALVAAVLILAFGLHACEGVHRAFTW